MCSIETFGNTLQVCKQSVPRQRIAVLKHFISLARHCHDMRNFNSMFAIISGLGSPPVARLKQVPFVPLL